ncbi:molybdenum cofactor biosynthesis protein MoaE [Caldinitratiruptor microaerophilus]|uniref:Molybdopterin synthase catalytic subunit n=1 Tax=Caldinitratiruptor microaerophilus TaxID=671077 RepID=A0AA35CMJ4_9FIRM|nr:molybdenum cofactor biosynthesis protein MoaE [Caldinitratiruptor microaerophilus]BDG62069.1 hypothetical protein caldi_31590 [Caldinitratiruptor microaerophilus]
MVRVRLFAGAAQAAGRRELSGDWAGLTAGEVVQELARQFPSLGPLAPTLALAVNREYVEPDHRLQDGDELALIPPVSGGEEALFEVVTHPLSADAVARKVVAPEIGAVVTFVGTVREWTHGRRTVHLEYEAYPEMAVREMERIAREIGERWPGARVAISHRVGRLEIGEASVVIAVGTPHRAGAFDACRYAIDRLKQIVPIWKKEVWENGEAWVGAQSGPPWQHPEKR